MSSTPGHGELADYPGGAEARIAVVEDLGIAQGGIDGDVVGVGKSGSGVGSRGWKSRSKGIFSLLETRARGLREHSARETKGELRE